MMSSQRILQRQDFYNGVMKIRLPFPRVSIIYSSKAKNSKAKKLQKRFARLKTSGELVPLG